MKVGFIGLGTMGASMAANLQKAGYDVVVHDIRRAAAERHLAAGAVWVLYCRQEEKVVVWSPTTATVPAPTPAPTTAATAAATSTVRRGPGPPVRPDVVTGAAGCGPNGG